MRVIVYALVLVALSVAAFLSTEIGTRSAIFLYDEVRPFVTRYTTPFCISRLQAKNVNFTQIGDQHTGQCRVLNAVRVRSVEGTRLSKPVIMTCGLALSLSEWIADINQISQEQFGQKIDTLHHSGTYNCRRQRSSSVLSEHAYGNAIDINGFTIKERRLSVGKDWRNSYGKPFLRKSFNSACWEFGLVLGPGSDGRHEGHFHLDNGSYFGLSKWRCVL